MRAADRGCTEGGDGASGSGGPARRDPRRFSFASGRRPARPTHCVRAAATSVNVEPPVPQQPARALQDVDHLGKRPRLEWSAGLVGLAVPDDAIVRRHKLGSLPIPVAMISATITSPTGQRISITSSRESSAR